MASDNDLKHIVLKVCPHNLKKQNKLLIFIIIGISVFIFTAFVFNKIHDQDYSLQQQVLLNQIQTLQQRIQRLENSVISVSSLSESQPQDLFYLDMKVVEKNRQNIQFDFQVKKWGKRKRQGYQGRKQSGHNMQEFQRDKQIFMKALGNGPDF